MNGADDGHGKLRTLHQLLQQLHHQRAGGRVEAGGRLIENQYVRRLEELHADGEPLLLAAGAAGHSGVANRLHAEHLNQLIDASFVVEVDAANVLQPGGEGHRLDDGQRRHQVVILGNESDASIANVLQFHFAAQSQTTSTLTSQKVVSRRFV